MNGNLKIDDVDVKILKTLLEEPRTTFAEIAKDCGLSITSIRNRFNSMKESGIVTGSIMQINPKSFGYDCVAFAKVETDPRYKKEVEKFLAERPRTAVYSPHITGRNSIVAFVVARNTDELSQDVNQIRKHPYVRSVITDIWIDVKKVDYPENLIINTTDEFSRQGHIISNLENKKYALTAKRGQVDTNENLEILIESHKLDDIDISLIKILSRNAQISFRRIAHNLGISVNNVIERYKKLRKKVLTFSSITVNIEKLGYIGTGVMSIKVSKESSVNETFDKIIQVPNVIVAIKVLGSFDILIMAPFRTFDNLTDLTEKIGNIPGVYAFNTTIDKPYPNWPLNLLSKILTQ